MLSVRPNCWRGHATNPPRSCSLNLDSQQRSSLSLSPNASGAKVLTVSAWR